MSADAALLHVSKASKQAVAAAWASASLVFDSLRACEAVEVSAVVAPVLPHAVIAAIETKPKMLGRSERLARRSEIFRDMDDSYLVNLPGQPQAQSHRGRNPLRRITRARRIFKNTLWRADEAHLIELRRTS